MHSVLKRFGPQAAHMKREIAEQFSKEIENYRRALLYYARAADWATFQARASRLFDYVESVEFRELERRFFRTFGSILTALIIALVAFFSSEYAVHPAYGSMRTGFLLFALAVTTFELYFFVDYRRYIVVRTLYREQRRRLFLRGIEEDFRANAAPNLRQAA
jgi:hypothetical protein